MRAIKRRSAMRTRNLDACWKDGNAREAARSSSAVLITGPVTGRMDASFTGSTIPSSIRFRINIFFCDVLFRQGEKKSLEAVRAEQPPEVRREKDWKVPG